MWLILWDLYILQYFVNWTESQISVSRDVYIAVGIVAVSKFTVVQKLETKISVFSINSAAKSMYIFLFVSYDFLFPASQTEELFQPE